MKQTPRRMGKPRISIGMLSAADGGADVAAAGAIAGNVRARDCLMQLRQLNANRKQPGTSMLTRQSMLVLPALSLRVSNNHIWRPRRTFRRSQLLRAPRRASRRARQANPYADARPCASPRQYPCIMTQRDYWARSRATRQQNRWYRTPKMRRAVWTNPADLVGGANDLRGFDRLAVEIRSDFRKGGWGTI